jgi:RNA polymerase sigma-70 factor (ECF subfamily)
MIEPRDEAVDARSSEVRPSPRDESDLITGVLERRPEAIADLFDRFGQLVRRVLIHTVGNIADIDDLAQETFLRIIARCSTLRDPSAFRSFVVSIAVRTAKNELRKRNLRSWIGLGTREILPCSPPPDEVTAEAASRVLEILDTFDADARIAFILRHVEGYDLLELTKAYGCSMATIKRRLARIEKRFEVIARSDPSLRPFLDDEAS